MSSRTVKLTGRNQLTLPRAVLETLGWPSHFRVQLAGNALVLLPKQALTGADLAAERILQEERALARRGGGRARAGL